MITLIIVFLYLDFFGVKNNGRNEIERNYTVQSPFYDNIYNFNKPSNDNSSNNSKVKQNLLNQSDEPIIYANRYKPKKRYVPCDTVCCSVGLRVCRYKGQPDYITIDTIQGDTNPNLCNADSLFIYDPHIGGFGGGNPIGDPSGGSSSASYIVAGYNVPCINRCDWLDILTSEAYYGKRATPNEPTNNILVKNECRLLTYLY